jgi:hypothetical protein
MYGVGIDLGTSFTAAAIAVSGTLDMVRLGGQATVTPSVAYLDDDGKLLTGEVADRLGLQDPSRAAREFKRRLGDPTPVILGGAPHSPTALMAAMLHAVLDSVIQAQGGPPDHIVLTHPAVWGAYRREQFAAIPQLAGLPRPQTDPGSAAGSGGPMVFTATEPVAAATYYCSTQPLPPDGLLAVYDLGGGTFDSAVVRNGRDGLEIIGTPEGIEWLGGADLDQAVVDHVDRHLGGAVTALDPTDPGTAPILAALHRECMLAKEALSTREQAEVAVSLPDSVRRVTVTREAFEQMTKPSLETTVETFRRTLVAAGITPQDLTAVLLVGGSSQIPLVSQMLRDVLRRPIMINTHPKHAVALGAAMLSAEATTVRRMPAPTGAAPAQVGRGASTAAPVVVAAPQAPTAGRGTRGRSRPPTAALVRAPGGPAGHVPPPVGTPGSPKRRRRSKSAVMRLAVALVVALGLLGVVIALGPKALNRGQLLPKAEGSPSASTQSTAPATAQSPAPAVIGTGGGTEAPGDIYVAGLGFNLAIGVDSSGHQSGWLSADQGIVTLRYPNQQSWGIMFITVGVPAPPGNRSSVDLSSYRSLTAEMRWTGTGVGCVRLGIKGRTQPDDGTETTVPECLTGTWSTIRIPLSAFTGVDLSHVYVAFEVVFGNRPMIVQLRNIRYSTTS